MGKTVTLLIVLALIILGVYFLFSGEEALAPEDGRINTPQDTSLEVPAPGFENVPETIVSEEGPGHTVFYTKSGFSPATITINEGESVMFVNKNSRSMWVASDVHPTHAVYSGTTLNEHCGGGAANESFDQCGSGESYSFIFNKAGTWKYHNHLQASHTGTIIVE